LLDAEQEELSCNPKSFSSPDYTSTTETTFTQKQPNLTDKESKITLKTITSNTLEEQENKMHSTD